VPLNGLHAGTLFDQHRGRVVAQIVRREAFDAGLWPCHDCDAGRRGTSASVSHDFSTEVHRDGDAIVILVRGEVDIATAERLRDAIEPHLGPQQTIVLDMSGVEFMDSACLAVLVQARGTLTADGGSLTLRNPSRAAHRLLTVLGLEGLLQADTDEHGDSNRPTTRLRALPPGNRNHGARPL
jgi:anti-sigma B factor antagonist